MPFPAMKPKKQMETPEMGGSTVLNSKDYPELQGVQQGQKISGSFEATIDGIEGDSVTLKYDQISLQAENSADRELARITGKKSPMAQSGEQSGEEEEY